MAGALELTPRRPRRQLAQGLPTFTQEQFLQVPERLQWQQDMVPRVYHLRTRQRKPLTEYGTTSHINNNNNKN